MGLILEIEQALYLRAAIRRAEAMGGNEAFVALAIGLLSGDVPMVFAPVIFRDARHIMGSPS